MSVEVRTTWAQLDELEGDWPAAGQGPAASPTQQPRWFLTAARTLYDRDQLHVTVVRQDDRVTAIAPLGRSRGLTGGRLEVLGSRDLHEPSGLAHRHPQALAQLLDAIVATGRAVHLGRLHAGGPEARQLAGVPRHRAVTAQRPAPGTPVVPIDTSWAAFEASLSPSRRSSLRRNARRAHEAGGFELEISAPTLLDVEELVDEFVAVEHQSWKGAAGTSLAADDRLRRFYRAYARASAAAGELRVSRLRIGGRPAAAQLAVESGGRLWVLKLGYDEQWSRCAPGIALTHGTLRWAFDHGLAAYELLGDAAPWTSIWTDLVQRYNVVRLYPASPRAFGDLAGDALTQARKRVGRQAGR